MILLNFSVIILITIVYTCSVPGARQGAFIEALNYGKTLTGCKLVTFTVLIGSYDKLNPQLGSNSSTVQCFVAITDKKESILREPYIKNGWTVVECTVMPFDSIIRNTRVPKILGHLFFPLSDTIIYIDASAFLYSTPSELYETYFKDPKIELLVKQHPRNPKNYSIEASNIIRLRLDSKNIVSHQVSDYSILGLPSLVIYAGARMQRNTKKMAAFNCLWFVHYMSYSRRDQLSIARAFEDMNLFQNTVMINGNAKKFFDRVPHHVSRNHIYRKDSPTICDTVCTNESPINICTQSEENSIKMLRHWRLIALTRFKHLFKRDPLSSTTVGSEANSKTIVSETGAWDIGPNTRYYLDELFALSVAAAFTNHSIINFGAGIGHYEDLFRRIALSDGKSIRGYEGARNVENITSNLVHQLDLTKLEFVNPADFVLSSEVAEHIPPEYFC